MYIQRTLEAADEPYLIHLDTYYYHAHLHDVRFAGDGLFEHFHLRRLRELAVGACRRPQYVGTYRLAILDDLQGEPRSVPLTVFGSPPGWLVDYPAATYLGILSSKETERGGGEEFLLGLEQFVRYADAQITEVWDVGQRRFTPPPISPAPNPLSQERTL